MTAPTSEEVYLLELINETRLDPLGNAARYISSYTNSTAIQANIQQAIDFFGVSGSALLAGYNALVPTGPLAWSTELATAADKHSQAMIAADAQSHQVSGEADLSTRISNEGYQFRTAGENVYSYSKDLLFAHAGFMIDWGYDAVDTTNGTVNSNFRQTGDGMQDALGHRVNIMNSRFLEIGIDVTSENNSATQVGPQVITQDFGARDRYFVTGVVYTDSDQDSFYSIGEGRGDLTVRVGSVDTAAWSSGAYRAQLAVGSNTFTLTGGGLSGPVSITTSISTLNIKIDVVNGNTIKTSGSINITGAVSKIVALGLSGLVLTAGEGSQEFHGTIGNDTFNGGAGDDILVLSGTSSQFSAQSAAGGIVVTGPGEGSDTAQSIEIYRFNDGDFVFNQTTGSFAPLAQGGGGGSTGGGSGSTGGNGGTNVANNAPVFTTPSTYTISEDTDLIFTLEAIDADQDILAYASGVGTTGITWKNTDGTFTYRPKANFVGTDTFQVVADDNKGGVTYQTITINVTDVNDFPDLMPKPTYQTGLEAAVRIVVKVVEPDGDALTWSTFGVDNGVLTGSNGIYTFKPNKGFTGIEFFSVTADDGRGGRATLTIAVDVNRKYNGIDGSDPLPASTNKAPTLTAAASLNINEDVAISTSVGASDPDGDPLTYTFGTPTKGTITQGTNGNYTYTPKANVNGLDSFQVTVTDGKGGTAVQTVNVTIAAINDNPVAPATLSKSTTTSTPVQFTIAATDAESDPLTFSSAAPTNGSVAGGTGGVFTYTPRAGFSGRDTFKVTVSDGKGGTASTNVSIDVSAPLAAPTGPTFTLRTNDDFSGSIGGIGTVFGTGESQAIRLLDKPDNIIFDPSFNQGGDAIVFPNDASTYTVKVEGSQVTVRDNDSAYTIPIGPTGLPLVFADGGRKLVFDTATSTVKIGSQTVTGTATAISAIPDGSVVPSGLSLVANGNLRLSEDATVGVNGNFRLFGTGLGDETVMYGGGNLELDPSFNQGGDELMVPGAIGNYSAYLNGSSFVLTSPLGIVQIPFGATGLEINFDGNIKLLKFDTSAGVLKLGDQTITATSAATAQALTGTGSGGGTGGGGTGGGGTGGGTGTPNSLDVGSDTVPTVINLQSGQAFTLNDSWTTKTNVVINGFGSDDRIAVTGTNRYAFTSIDGDIVISDNDGVNFTQIVLNNVVSPNAFVFDEATAEAAAGWNFISFG